MFYNDPSISLVNPVNWDIAKSLESSLARKLADSLGLEKLLLGQPENSSHGDFSTNIAMQNAKELGKNPRQLAEEYLQKINSDESLIPYLEKAEVAGPGFINFFLKKEVFLNELERFAKATSTAKLPVLLGKTVMVEYAHPNPFKSFHIGHLRNIILGESLCRILEFLGANVIRVNYQGDVGMHIAKSIWGMIDNVKHGRLDIKDEIWKNEEGEKVKFKDMSSYEKMKIIGEMYAHGATQYEEDEDAKEEIKNINYAIYTIFQDKFLKKYPKWQPAKKYRDFLSDDELDFEMLEKLFELGKAWSLEEFQRIYERVYSKFEREFMESETLYHSDLSIKAAKKKEILKESEGAVIFDGKKYGLETRVFLNSLELPTYEGKELGLGEIKFEEFPNVDLHIHNVAVEQISFFKATFKVKELLDPKKYKGKQYHNAYEFVGLKSGKMSSRKGKVVLAEDILNNAKEKLERLMKGKEVENFEETLERIAVAAVKYSFLNISPFKYLAFDIDASLSFEGDSGPYILYTYSRGNKILRDYGGELELSSKALSVLNEDQEVNLIKYLSNFETAVIESGKNLSPNILTLYLFELSQKFNQFYKNAPILNEKEKTLRDGRLVLTKFTIQVLQEGLHLLGIKTVERM